MKTLPEQQAEAWRLAPDDAEWIAQGQSGHWFPYFNKEPKPLNLNFYSGDHFDDTQSPIFKGQINGWDWRDTLQSREQHEMTLFAKCAEPNCNAPVHGESDLCLSHQEDAQGPDHEDGPEFDGWEHRSSKKWMPEVGQECEWSQHNNDQWVWLKIHALTDCMAIVSEKTGNQFGVYLSQHAFRPTQPEADKLRDEQIEKLSSLLALEFSDKDFREFLADNLYGNRVRVLGPDERICKPRELTN